MKTSSLSGLTGEPGGARPISDEKMEQVRELLLGEFEKQTERRVAELESRVRELEVGLHRRLDAMQARLEALAGEVESDQRSAHDELATGLQDLAERVRRFKSQ